MPWKRLAVDDAIDHAVQPSAVHMYVCRLVSRSLLKAEAIDSTKPSKVDTLVPHLNSKIVQQDVAVEERMMDAKEEDEPDDWIVFEGEGSAVSEFRNIAAEQSYSADSPCRASSGGSFEKLTKGRDRMAGAVREGVAYVGEVGGKFVGSASKVGIKMGALSPALGGTWDAVDEAAERYAQQIEELVRLNAAMISGKSKGTYQEGAKSYMHKLEGCIYNSAALVSDKAKAVSKAAGAKAAYVKTSELSYTSMRRGLASAVRRGFRNA
jgi:hypothetical protein